MKRFFEAEGLAFNLINGNRYLRAYISTQEEFEAWVKTQVEAWAYRVRVLGKNPNETSSWLMPAW